MDAGEKRGVLPSILIDKRHSHSNFEFSHFHYLLEGGFIATPKGLKSSIAYLWAGQDSNLQRLPLGYGGYNPAPSPLDYRPMIRVIFYAFWLAMPGYNYCLRRGTHGTYILHGILRKFRAECPTFFVVWAAY